MPWLGGMVDPSPIRSRLASSPQHLNERGRRLFASSGAPLSGSRKLTIIADGGSNGLRARLWKRELQRPANKLRLEITVHHSPPGTSKLDQGAYFTGIRVSNEDTAALIVRRDPFHGGWDYTIKPRKPRRDAVVL